MNIDDFSVKTFETALESIKRHAQQFGLSPDDAVNLYAVGIHMRVQAGELPQDALGVTIYEVKAV